MLHTQTSKGEVADERKQNREIRLELVSHSDGKDPQDPQKLPSQYTFETESGVLIEYHGLGPTNLADAYRFVMAALSQIQAAVLVKGCHGCANFVCAVVTHEYLDNRPRSSLAALPGQANFRMHLHCAPKPGLQPAGEFRRVNNKQCRDYTSQTTTAA